MVHLKYLKLTSFLVITFFSLPFCLNAQSIYEKPNDSTLAFRFNLSLPTHYTVNSGSSFQNDLERDLFDDNFIFGLGADYFFKKNWALTTGFSLIYSKAEQTDGLFFINPPPPNTISLFETNYRFLSASLEPKIKFSLPYSTVNFFCSAGPIISYGVLSSETDGAPYQNLDSFRSTARSSSRSTGYGFTISTGMQMALNRSLALSLEVGYRLHHFSSFSLEDPINSEEFNSFDYRLNSFTPSAGVVYKL